MLARYHAVIEERQRQADAEEAGWEADKAAGRASAADELDALFGGEAA